MSEQTPVRSVSRAIDIMLVLADGPQALGAICERAGLSKATGHRLLAGLGHRGFVVQAPGGDYLLGPGCIRLVDAIVSGLGGLNSLSVKLLEELRDATQETVTLHIRQGDLRVCVQEIPSRHALRYTAGVGTSSPAYLGAAGKVLLAFAPSGDLDRYFKILAEQPREGRGVADLLAFRSELERVRRDGHAVSHGERVPGAAATSVPVFGDDERLLAALSILGPESRMDEDVLKRFSRLAKDAAAAIGKEVRRLSDGQVEDR